VIHSQIHPQDPRQAVPPDWVGWKQFGFHQPGNGVHLSSDQLPAKDRIRQELAGAVGAAFPYYSGQRAGDSAGGVPEDSYLKECELAKQVKVFWNDGSNKQIHMLIHFPLI